MSGTGTTRWNPFMLFLLLTLDRFSRVSGGESSTGIMELPDKPAVTFGYEFERGFIEVTSLFMMIAMASQIMVLRFTPHNHKNSSRRNIVIALSICLLLQIIRGVDPSGMFSLIPIQVQHGLVDQATSCLVDAFFVLLVASARSLYTLLHLPLPRSFELALFTIAVGYKLASLALWFGELALAGNDQKMLDVTGGRLIIFDVLCLTLLVAHWNTARALKELLRSAVNTLKEQEQRAHQRAAASTEHDRSRTLSPTIIVQSAGESRTSSNPSTGAANPRGAQLSGSSATNKSPTASHAVYSNRLLELQSATRKLQLMHVLAILAPLIGIGTNMDLLIRFCDRTQVMADYAPQKPDEFDFVNFAYPVVQQLCWAALLYYAWMSPSVANQHRVNAGFPFWPTLYHGWDGMRVRVHRIEVTPPEELEVRRRDSPDLPLPKEAAPTMLVNGKPAMLSPSSRQVAPLPSGASAGDGSGNTPTGVLIHTSSSPVAADQDRPVARHHLTVRVAPAPAVGRSVPAQALLSLGPMDSNASRIVTGLSMRSGITSVHARRQDGDQFDSAVLEEDSRLDEEDEASMIDSLHALAQDGPLSPADRVNSPEPPASP